jgi:hypothetical protein
MPLYEKKDRNGNWQRKQLYFHTIDAIIWKKKDRNGNWQRKLFHFNAINFIIS